MKVEQPIQEFKPNIGSTETIWDKVGIPSRGRKLHEALDKGFSVAVYSRLSKETGISKARVATIISIAPATLTRRMKSGTFSIDESDRLYRLTEVIDLATKLFEDDITSAVKWIEAPVKALGNKIPSDMLKTTAGIEEVINLIGRLEQGVFS